jgi:hypothetical protein
MSTPKRKKDDVHHSSGSDTETQPSPDLLSVLQPASKRPRAIPFGVPDGSPAAPDIPEPLPSAAPAAAASGSELKEGRFVKLLAEQVVRLTRHVVLLPQDGGSSPTEHIDRLNRGADAILVELAGNGRLVKLLTEHVVRLTRHVVLLPQDGGSSPTEHIDRLNRGAEAILVELEENGRLLQENNAVTPTAVPPE